MLKGRKDLGILTRRDLIINPLLTICDIPWVFMMAVTLVLIPWRFLTTFVKISKHQSHFPNCCMEVVRYDLITFTFKQGLLDYMTLPFYLISILHPQHWEPIVFRLILQLGDVPQPDFKNLDKVEEHERQKRILVFLLFFKTLNEFINFLVIFPINMISLFYLPLFVHLVTTAIGSILTQKQDKAQMLVRHNQIDLTALNAMDKFQVTGLFLDYVFPQGTKLAIRLVNREYIKLVPLVPLMIMTVPLNPYRSYQFFQLMGHNFVSGFKIRSLADFNAQEKQKRRDIVWCFKQSLTDFLTLVASIVIVITGFRALYLIAILSVNGHVTRFNGFLARITAERNPRMWIKL